MDVAAWLRGLGLEQYVPAFRDNDVDGEVLPELTADDLISIGVTSVGQRRKLLAAIAALGTEAPTAAPTAASATTSPPISDAERRQLTVMFCDLVGSTALSTRFDPEDLRELIGDYHHSVSATVGRFDGFVAKYMGDGVLVYFGYPRAHEDDAERAVRAGLAVIEAIGKLPAREGLRVRLGIATGLAVVGDLLGEGAAQERGVVGETPNLAARLQALAAPDSLVIAEATRRQIGGLFDLADLGPQALAGFGEPQPAWRVIGESGMLSRFEALRSGETPLVGREEEIELLLRRWQQAKSGEGRVVLISGEPGIGKSRLTAALSEHIGTEPHTRLRYFCSPHHQDSALYPLIAQLERAAGFTRDDTVEDKLGKLRTMLALGTRGDEDIALLSELLSLPSSAVELNLSPQRKREKLFEALLNQLEAEARRSPLLMAFEDAHWIDPTSRELLDLIIDRVRHLPVLLAITFRAEFQPPWSGRSHVTSLALNRLGERDGKALVQTLAGNAALAPDIVAEIVERTDGVPLFVEELTKAVLESAAQGDRVAAVLAATSLAVQSVPATLHASLMARLDRLGSAAKEIAQIGAVLGREFGYELIQPVALRPEKELQAALDQLGDAGLLFCRGTAPHASYLFKHALVQDAAYGTLLRGPRQLLHGRIADVLLTTKPPAAPEIVAHHLQNAARSSEAVDYWRQAGEQAVRRAANREGIEHFRHALSQIEARPETAERWRTELAILSQLAPALMTVQGWSATEVGEAVERAAAVGRRLESSADLAPSIANLWLYNWAQARFDRADRISADLFRIAGELDDPEILLQAHHCTWPTFWRRGAFAQAGVHVDVALKLYNEERHAYHCNVYLGHDPAVCGLGVNASVQDALGYPDRALRCEVEAIALARRLGHAPSLAHALWLACEARAARGDARRIPALAANLLKLSEERELPQPRANALILLGWALARSGDTAEGIVKLQEGLGSMKQLGVRPFLPRSLCLMAEALSVAGRFADGLERVTQALDIAAETGDVCYVPQLHQTRAELLLHTHGRDEEAVEVSLRQALAVAREQGAKGYELRAATRLAHLWFDRGRCNAARELLAPVFAWFTEGFDTADLKEAKALLDELT